MSWINEIAGKAEDFLNKIDHGAANVLKKEKKKKARLSPPLTEDNFVTQSDVVERYTPSPAKKSSPARTTPELESNGVIISEKEDDRILDYLNNSNNIDSLKFIGKEEETPLLITQRSEDVNILIDERINDISTHERTNGISTHERTNGISTHESENELLRNEVRSLSSEVSLLMARTKSSERELALTKSLLAKKEGDAIVHDKEINSLKQRLANIESENTELYNENISLKKINQNGFNEEKVLENERKLSEYQLDTQKREEALKGDIASLRIRISELEQTLLKEKSENAKELSEINNRLAEARKELEDYRARAQRTLSEKDKLIGELKKEGIESDSQQICSLELQQLREESGNLVSELEEIRSKLEISRKQELEAEKRLEMSREEATSALRSAQARLAEETARRLAAEEHSTSHAEELHSVRDELWRQVSSLNSKLKEREKELSRLRRQLSERVVTRPEPELTAALVKKQENIEQLTIEVNQLRFQLERLKLSYRENKVCETVNVNDTDDAKAQLPSFMLRSPFDRSMKQVYSCVDRLSRAVFLRRQPFARIVLFCYLVMLHLGLCFVLFSYTPDNLSNV